MSYLKTAFLSLASEPALAWFSAKLRPTFLHSFIIPKEKTRVTATKGN